MNGLMALSRSWALLSGGAPGGSVELLRALESKKGWKLLKLREALFYVLLDVQSGNPTLKTSLVGVQHGLESSGG